MTVTESDAPSKPQRVAIIHYWLVGMQGGRRSQKPFAGSTQTPISTRMSMILRLSVRPSAAIWFGPH